MRVGVIVPVHGWAPYLAEALDSVLAEEPDEVVVVDDGSPEGVQLHVAHAERCRVVRLPARGGLPAARRAGFDALRSSDWVALCDADDAWRPGKLDAQRAAVRAADADGCFALAEIVGPDGLLTGETWGIPAVTLPEAYVRNAAAVSGVLLRREAVVAAGGIARDMAAAEDWDLWLRLLASGATLTVAGDARVAYRRHPGAMSGDVTTLARAQLAVHATHAGLVDETTRRAVEAADLRALAAGLTRDGDFAAAAAALRAAARIERLGTADRVRLRALSVPGLRSALGRRDPYRG
jgi:GT2 family glycosyltransferase